MSYLPRRRAVLAVAALSLAACAGVPLKAPGASGPARFDLQARFSVRIENGGAPRSASGQLVWQRAAGEDRLLLQGPFGAGMAEIRAHAGGAVLRQASGESRRAASADALLAEVTGYALPVDRLAGWLFGQPGPGGRLLRDPLGRPLRLLEEGWRVDYRYAEEAPDTPPTMLELVRETELELRLRVESWGNDE